MTPHERRLRSICQDRCAEAGDPPCYELDAREGKDPTWCMDCRIKCGEEPETPLDPNAVVAPLL